MTLGVVVFPGSNCDRDVQWAAQGCLGIETRFLWHEERDLSGEECPGCQQPSQQRQAIHGDPLGPPPT